MKRTACLCIKCARYSRTSSTTISGSTAGQLACSRAVRLHDVNRLSRLALEQESSTKLGADRLFCWVRQFASITTNRVIHFGTESTFVRLRYWHQFAQIISLECPQHAPLIIRKHSASMSGRTASGLASLASKLRNAQAGGHTSPIVQFIDLRSFTFSGSAAQVRDLCAWHLIFRISASRKRVFCANQTTELIHREGLAAQSHS